MNIPRIWMIVLQRTYYANSQKIRVSVVGEDEHYWSHRQMDISSWEGYAFEQVCLHHIPQIKKKLGITGILSNVCTWSYRGVVDAEGNKQPGAQIDLIIDRGDKTINLCEMKYVNQPYTISSDYAAWLIKRREFRQQVYFLFFNCSHCITGCLRVCYHHSGFNHAAFR